MLRSVLAAGPALALSAALVAFGPLPALAGATDFASMPEGTTLDTVTVEEGWGDGRVTERDARAFCEFCLWGINRYRAELGQTEPLAGDEVIGRLQDFWVRVWEHVDAETKQTISYADALWPPIQEQLAAGGEEYAAQLASEFYEFAVEVWGGYENETLAYLDGSLPGFMYEMVVSEQIAMRQAAQSRSRGGSVSGSVPSFSPYGEGYRDDLNTSYVVNDGSGDIMYIDE